MATPARQPFGSVSDARLRKLTNLKNKQNALAAAPSSAVKRQAPADFDEPDTENIDPRQFFSESSKKAKTFDFDSSTLSKAPRFALNVTPANTPTKRSNLSHAAGSKRKAEPTTSTPPIPSSAPAPSAAGRSPKHKRIGILSKRRHTTTSSNNITRIDPPSFSSRKAVTQPFSIAAALHGTVPTSRISKHQAKKPSPSKKGWHFAIHEDTQDDEMANLMQHSTQTLEISDDEGSRSSSPGKGDRCNKENVAPADYAGAAAAAGANGTSRRDLMTEEVRAPLGDLDTKDYYAEGCGVDDVIVIPAEDDDEAEGAFAKNSNVTEEPSPTAANGAAASGWEEILAKMSSTHGNKNATETPPIEHYDNEDDDAQTEIQIWESESAKDEGEGIVEAGAATAAATVVFGA